MELLMQSAVAVTILCLLAYGVLVLLRPRDMFSERVRTRASIFFVTRLVQGSVTVLVGLFLLW